MDLQERTNDLLMRAENKGFRFHYDSGFLVVSLPATGDCDAHADVISELGHMLHHVRRVIAKRATFSRSQGLLGKRVWTEFGMGTLSGSDPDGRQTVSVSGAQTRSANLMVNAEALFVLMEPENAPMPPERVAEPKRKRMFGLLP